MKPIPISHEYEWVDPTTIEPKKLSGLTKGILIGLGIVIVFWALVFIIAGTMLVLH